MQELYYNAYAIAYFLVSQDFDPENRMELLNRIYTHESDYLIPEYRENKRKFFSEVLLCRDCLIDRNNLDKEFPAIERDFKASGLQFDRMDLISDFPEIDLFFMYMRLRILHLEGKDYVRMKLRTLLKHYGYKRRSAQLNEHFRDCLMFYHIQPYLKNGVECDIREIDLDDMVTFRVL